MKWIIANSAPLNGPITNFPRAKRRFFCKAYGVGPRYQKPLEDKIEVGGLRLGAKD
jgi:hypothetical protein